MPPWCCGATRGEGQRQRFWQPLPRSPRREILDAEGVATAELGTNLDDLQRINTLLGHTWLVVAAVQRLWRRAGRPARLRVLDVGTGAADIPRALGRWGRRRGVAVCVVAVDRSQDVLRHARRRSRPSESLMFVQADALALPFREGAFDVVLSSALLHHLSWEEGVVLLRAMAAAGSAVVVSDLVRSRWCYVLARLLLALLSRNAITRHDGPLSVLRAYRVGEVRAMAKAAGLARGRVWRALPHRLLLVAEKG
ncbi:MAG: hypothetical protein KatS3mg131_1162 [Candidatus Tectimicrobiota bacterium]|nr:MAG: hypothetical protein KatS3mg131_1162 [Candidatus Tectomicrobia bacterium]